MRITSRTLVSVTAALALLGGTVATSGAAMADPKADTQGAASRSLHNPNATTGGTPILAAGLRTSTTSPSLPAAGTYTITGTARVQAVNRGLTPPILVFTGKASGPGVATWRITIRDGKTGKVKQVILRKGGLARIGNYSRARVGDRLDAQVTFSGRPGALGFGFTLRSADTTGGRSTAKVVVPKPQVRQSTTVILAGSKWI